MVFTSCLTPIRLGPTTTMAVPAKLPPPSSDAVQITREVEWIIQVDC